MARNRRRRFLDGALIAVPAVRLRTLIHLHRVHTPCFFLPASPNILSCTLAEAVILCQLRYHMWSRTIATMAMLPVEFGKTLTMPTSASG